MESDNPDSKPDDQQGQGPEEQEKKNGSHGQIGNLQDPAEDQTSDAQLNQGQGDQSNKGGPIELSQHEPSSEDVFSDEASNDSQQRNNAIDGGPSEQKI